VPGHDIIVIGTSAGGVEALTSLARELPADLPAALFVVLHIPAQNRSVLASILDRAGPLEAVQASDRAPVQHGRIYVASPDHHLIVERGHIRIVRGPRENRHRPAIDPLFRTAARAYGPRVVGVVLTGSLDDGTAGLLAIKERGGVTVVQDPSDALYPGMPRSALEHVEIDHCLLLRDLAPLLVRLAHQPAPDEQAYPVPHDMEMESLIVELDANTLQGEHRPGAPSALSCPECGGVLWELHDGKLTRFRCRVGHAFSLESMLIEQNEALDEALWIALKTLEEKAVLSRRIAEQARERQNELVAERFDARVKDIEQRATVIREVLTRDEVVTMGDLFDAAPVVDQNAADGPAHGERQEPARDEPARP
jgi:two-component system, chemotaxis family, protein-glutamate methylesterase/glutaminase